MVCNVFLNVNLDVLFLSEFGRLVHMGITSYKNILNF